MRKIKTYILEKLRISPNSNFIIPDEWKDIYTDFAVLCDALRDYNYKTKGPLKHKNPYIEILDIYEELGMKNIYREFDTDFYITGLEVNMSISFDQITVILYDKDKEEYTGVCRNYKILKETLGCTDIKMGELVLDAIIKKLMEEL